MELFIKAKNAEYFKRLGFSTKTIGSRVLFDKMFDSVYENMEGSYASVNRQIIRSFEKTMIEKSEEFKEVLGKIESSIKEKKEEKSALIESILEKEKEIKEKKEKKDKKKKKTKYEILKEKVSKMDKDELIETISENLDKQDKSYLAELAYDLEVEKL